MAVGTDKGLVVPVVRDCIKSLAEIEGDRRLRPARATALVEGCGAAPSPLERRRLRLDDPIAIAQSGILGMHKIQERPMVIAGKIEPRP